MGIDYKGMSEYYCKSERTLRRWEQEKPEKFKIMFEEYMRERAGFAKDDRLGNVIAVISLKGGVGKSTISDALGYYLGDAVVLNLDDAQPASRTNSTPTVDYSDYYDDETGSYDKSVEDVVRELSGKYRYVIVDTPGESKGGTFEALKMTSNVVVPMTTGKRARDATQLTLETFFGEGTTLSGDYRIFFFFNAYTNKEKRNQAASLFKNMFKEFKPSGTVNIMAKLGALDYSDAIFTSEESGKSVMGLIEENRVAYRSVMKKISALCRQIEDHFGLE